MAAGHQDYQRGVVPVKSNYGTNQKEVFFFNSPTIDPGDTNVWELTTVPTGYRYNIFGVRIFSDAPYGDQGDLVIDGTSYMSWLVYGLIMDNLPGENHIVASAGETIEFHMTNNDTITKEFFIRVFTFRESAPS